jgi:3-oxoacyl-[acyl-carrier protein] reductase
MSKLSGQTAPVTGASGGIGRVCSIAPPDAGAQAPIRYRRAVNEGKTVAEQLRKAGERADAIGVDLADPDAPHRLAKQVRGIDNGVSR